MSEPIQEVITLIEFIGQIPNGATQQAESPIVGYTMIYGLVWADQNLTINIDLGVNDVSGPPKLYRHTISIALVSGMAQPIEVPIVGKFARVRLVNVSGTLANVEAFIGLRKQE